MSERNREAVRLAEEVVSGSIVQKATERFVYQIVEVCAEHERENTEALRARLEDMRKANEGMAAERDALRARVAKLEAALELIKSYAEAHDDEWVPFTVDEALKGDGEGV